ncbi:histone-lysine N-methyltransferase SETMAR-like [Octopus sinensis]|uniref:Histone-lysine N-methyltransferase SETMAR-like n=1 Tax=Octopus sinensis TaxID=2607531 RepID=A0A6P7SNB7_9MOLL|nr:histone-lysine N-methyltransferase SETMAR-like [Octopus sinensis]
MLTTEQYRVIFLYEYKLDHSATEALRNIKRAFGNDSVDFRTVRRWFQRFRSGNEILKNEPRRRPKSVIRHDQLNALVKGNPRTTVRKIGSLVQTSPATACRHLKKIGKVKKMDRFVPHQLNDIQRNRRLTVCSKLISRLYRLITCDEKWILFDNSRWTGQWLDERESPKHYPKPSLHHKKMMITVSWSIKGVIHYSFLQQGKTVTATSYCREIDFMHEKLKKKQPRLVN